MTSSIFTDHSALTDMVEVGQVNAFRPSGTRFGYTQSFWASTARAASSSISEVLEITFTHKYLINSVRLELAKYPHVMRMQYFDDQDGTWHDLTEAGGASVVRVVHECVPSQIPPPSSVTGHLHPQHAFLDHWQGEQIKLRPIEVVRLRLVLTRQDTGNAPTDIYGNKIHYSLAVRGLAVGYEVTSLDDVPRKLPADGSDGSYQESFAEADDAISSSLSFRLRTLDAERTIRDNAPDLAWHCEPQSDPNCVVSLYADVRSNDGQPQVIDRIFLDPINNGGHVTAYFAQDVPTTDFLSPAKPINVNSLRTDASPGILVDNTGMSFPAGGSLILDNQDFSYEVGTPWWFGMTVVPNFDMGGSTQTVFDCGAWRFEFTDVGLTLTTSEGTTLPLDFDYQSGSPVSVVVSHQDRRLQFWLAGQLGNAVAQTTLSALLPGVSKMAIGSSLDRSSTADCRITNLVIKNEIPGFDGAAYRADPRSFTRVESYPLDEPSTSRLNAVLRFDPLTVLQSPQFPWCIFGGTPSRFEAMTWTPVNRDYICQRGWMELPPIRASFWKLEFTGLPPVYSDVYLPIAREVRHFPVSVLASYRARMAAAAPPPVAASDDAHAVVAAHTNYVDTPVVVSTGGTGLGFTNTEVYVADDYATAERLYRQFGENWNYQQASSGYSAPRFESKQVHYYQTDLISRTSKIAYQIGLRSLKFARSDPAARYDVPQYEEMFYDTSGIEVSSNWNLDSDKLALNSGNASKSQVVSRGFHSYRKVRGLQFAAQQTPPQQIIADSEFLDPTANTWQAVGDANLGASIESTAFGRLLPVNRVIGTGFWEDIGPRYLTWGGIEAAGATWADLTAPPGSPTSSPDGNGVASEQISVPSGGYLYAAARVVADTDLSAPLWLQIIDPSGLVLAEAEAKVRKGQVTEWYTTYELGSHPGESTRITWAELVGDVHLPSFQDAFTRADATTLGRTDSAQLWLTGEKWNGTAGSPLHIVSNRAQVTVTGQRSVLDLQTPWGTLAVQLGHIVTGATEMIDIGGLVVLANGNVIDSETGRLYTTLAGLVDDDTLSFQFMPTAQVPAGESSGADASISSWSVVISRNGSFVTTISTTRPFDTVRGIAGAVGQNFRSFNWTPSSISIPIETIILQNPVPRDGSLDIAGDAWIQSSDGRRWAVTGTFNVVDNGIQQTLQAPTGQSFSLATDVGEMYGALRSKIALSGTTASSTYFVMQLDAGASSSLYLQGNGDLVQFVLGTGYTTLAAGVVPSFSDTTTVLFANTAKLSSSFMTAHALSSSQPQTLVFLNGGSVVGTYQGTNLWTGTLRAVMGTDGSSITGFTWGPDLGANATGSSARTWDDISGSGTRTWDEIARNTVASTQATMVQVRVVQKDVSSDNWYMDSAPLYADPIVWEFSNDDGQSWQSASTIRNNPKGVILFDTSSVSNRLRYRVTSFGRNSWLSHLVMRPWYIGYMRDVPQRAEAPHGPNLQPLDHYQPVEQDPNFMVWNLPIPREWWFAFRSLLPSIGPPADLHPTITERELI